EAPDANPFELAPELAGVSNRVHGSLVQACVEHRGDVLFPGEGEDGLPDSSAVERHPLTDPGAHLNRMTALDLFEVDDMRLAGDAKMHGVARALRQLAEDRQRLGPDVEALVHGHTELQQGQPEPVAVALRVLVDKPLCRERSQQAVDGALLETALL